MSAAAPVCSYCRAPAELVSGGDLFAHLPDLASKWFWRCEPCKAHVGCHEQGAEVRGSGGRITLSDGTLPFGTLANAALRSARTAAHGVFDLLWQSGRMRRSEAYAWLSEQLGVPFELTHISMFDIGQCMRVMDAVEGLDTRAHAAKASPPDETRWLRQAGIDHEVADDGHLVLTAKGQTIDYWPATQRWSIRGHTGEQKTLHALIRFCVAPARR